MGHLFLSLGPLHISFPMDPILYSEIWGIKVRPTASRLFIQPYLSSARADERVWRNERVSHFLLPVSGPSSSFFPCSPTLPFSPSLQPRGSNAISHSRAKGANTARKSAGSTSLNFPCYLAFSNCRESTYAKRGEFTVSISLTDKSIGAKWRARSEVRALSIPHTISHSLTGERVGETRRARRGELLTRRS